MQLGGKGRRYLPFVKELVSNISVRQYNIHQKMLDGYQSKEVKIYLKKAILASHGLQP